MPQVTLRWTPEMVRSLPDDGNRYELLDGMLLVTPVPIPLHQRAVTSLWRALADYVERHTLGEALLSPADIQLEPDTIVQPDVFVVPPLATPLTRSWQDVRALLLAVEVLSPGSRRHDRLTKRAFFARVGVPEHWVVDPEARLVERWAPADARAVVEQERLEWQPAGAAEPFALALPDFFARVHGEQRG